MTEQAAAGTPEAYDRLVEHVRRMTNVGNAAGLLSWDQQVMMPEEGTPARSKQQSALSSVHHDMLTDDDLGAWLDDLDGADLDADRRAVVREVRRKHERAVSVPSELVERISETTSNALPVWEEARREDDFASFEPTLAELVDLKREYAAHIDPDRDPYEVLFEEYEPYLGIGTAEAVLTTLREELVPLIEAVEDSDVDPADPFEGTYDPDRQDDLARSALDALGYDWEHGRLDTSTHPFTMGTQFDARVTTRFDETDPLEGLGSTVHESQSRLWENHVGRSRAFWEFFWPTFTDHFDVDATAREAYEAANRIYPDNLIRVEADELTYHLHVVVRFEIERDLIRGDLEAAEVPAVWNDKMEQYLGIRPDTDAEGCLQDIHWTHGNFGYFPTYSLGSVLAAQLFAAAEDDLDDIEGKIREGEFGPLHDWLRERVHRHGCRYTTDDLIREATGEGFTADYFVEYATRKFGDLYDL